MNKILLVGCGYWGKNWYNTIKSSEHNLVAVVDPNPVIEVQTPLFKAIEDVNVEYTHVIIATNAELHKDLFKRVKCAPPKVLIEKPCGTDLDRQDLLGCFPGYIFLSSPQYKTVKRIIDSNQIGEIIYSRFERASMGPRIRTDVSIIEDYAIHDLYLYQDLFNPKDIKKINKTLHSSFSFPIKEDTLFLNIEADNHVSSFFSSWRHPVKTRKIVIVGTRGSVIWENDRVVLDSSMYSKINGIDSNRNVGYDLRINTPVLEFNFSIEQSNLHLQLDDFLSGVDRSNNFIETTKLINKIKGYDKQEDTVR